MCVCTCVCVCVRARIHTFHYISIHIFIAIELPSQLNTYKRNHNTKNPWNRTARSQCWSLRPLAPADGGGSVDEANTKVEDLHRFRNPHGTGPGMDQTGRRGMAKTNPTWVFRVPCGSLLGRILSILDVFEPRAGEGLLPVLGHRTSFLNCSRLLNSC